MEIQYFNAQEMKELKMKYEAFFSDRNISFNMHLMLEKWVGHFLDLIWQQMHQVTSQQGRLRLCCVKWRGGSLARSLTATAEHVSENSRRCLLILNASQGLASFRNRFCWKGRFCFTPIIYVTSETADTSLRQLAVGVHPGLCLNLNLHNMMSLVCCKTLTGWLTGGDENVFDDVPLNIII